MIDCISIVNEIKENIKKEISEFERSPCLAIIQIGDNPASNNYIKGKLKDCKEVGIKAELIKLPDSIDNNTIRNKIINLNINDSVDGIILQLPLPDHLKKYEHELTNLIDLVRKKEWPFKHEEIVRYYDIYKKLKDNVILN